MRVRRLGCLSSGMLAEISVIDQMKYIQYSCTCVYMAHK